MKEEIYYDQWLQGTLELSAHSAQKLLENFPAPQELLAASKERLSELLPEGQLQAVLERRKSVGSVAGMQEEYEKLSQKGIRFVSGRQEAFPVRLRDIPDPPAGLYYRGGLPCRDRLAVAVIGARDCTEYGRHVAKELGDCLGRRGIEVISGMARGIDGISQQAALEAGGISFGILGSGVDICYPASNRGLYDLLAERGGIFSTYPPGTPPIPRNFPPRNRIVSGLADAVVVVEAREKSGTLITVDMALEQGREVYVVPGRVTDRLSDGCNKLLRQGAEVYRDPESFLEELEELAFLKKIAPGGWRKQSGKTQCAGRADEAENQKMQGKKADAEEQKMPWKSADAGKALKGRGEGGERKEEWEKVYRALDDTPKSLEQISAMLGGGFSVQELGVILMELAMDGRARQVSAGYFCRS